MARTKQFKEEETLLKAVDLFWKKGFHATSMQDLVDGLGISRSSLYDTYGGKDELFAKAFSKYRESAGTNMKQHLAEFTSVKEGLLKLFEKNIDGTLNDPDAKGCFVVNVTTELVPSDKALKEVVFENRRASEELFLSYLQKGVETGEIPKEKDLPSIASMLFTLNNGLQVVAKTKPSKEELMNMVKVALQVLD